MTTYYIVDRLTDIEICGIAVANTHRYSNDGSYTIVNSKIINTLAQRKNIDVSSLAEISETERTIIFESVDFQVVTDTENN